MQFTKKLRQRVNSGNITTSIAYGKIRLLSKVVAIQWKMGKLLFWRLINI